MWAAIKPYLTLAAGIALALLFVSTILPWAAESGWAGSVIRQNHRDDVDASALFYTDSERVMEILSGRK